MYTDEDLNFGVKKGIFTESAVNEFRSLLSSSKNLHSVDEENFRLISGFNDIFIVIACSLLLFSSVWVLKSVNDSLAYLVFSLLSWGLSEFFVLKRKMALPAIMLLLSFIAGVFAFSMSLFPSHKEAAFIVTTIIAYLHWLRFKVPITVAVGTATAGWAFVSILMSVIPETNNWILPILYLCGVIAFVYAMYWDSSDTNRTTGRSDVAFWLHLLSAPLIIHPIFSSLGIFNGNESLISMAVVIVLYLLMTLISIAVDRRIFMISSLVYVLYALSAIIKTYGGVGYSFALTGIFMGGTLLLLSVYWHSSRVYVVMKLPDVVTTHLPKI